jgi:hypothetical protein
MTKTCKKCGEVKEKSLDFFYAHPQAKDGFHSWCKICHAKWREEYRDKRIAQMKAWVASNADYVKQQQSKHYQENKEHRIKSVRERSAKLAAYPIEIEKRKVRSKLWRDLNPDKNRKKEANRRAKKEQRTPIWFSDFDEFVIQQACQLAKIREKIVGGKWHVDHVIPLYGKSVSGFHVANNFEVVPQKYNVRKSNKFDVDVGVSRFIG